MMKLTEILFEGKRVWRGAENVPNPDLYGGSARLKSDVRAKFELSKFARVVGLEEQLEFLRTTGMFVGAGSSRIVFAVSPKKVVKLAGGWDEASGAPPSSRYVQAGRAQNKVEYEAYKTASPEERMLLPVVYEAGPNYAWIMCELVRPLRSDDELRAMLYLSTEQYAKFMDVIGYGRKSFEEFVASLGGEAHKVFDRLAKLAEKLDLHIGDMSTIDQWGKTADGRLVLLDTGATEEVMRSYYREE
jgi:hypothetical protein